MLRAPVASGELLECLFSGLRGGRGVDRPKGRGNGLAILPARIVQAVPDQVNDARLNQWRKYNRRLFANGSDVTLTDAP
jgi:hypothetical protein